MVHITVGTFSNVFNGIAKIKICLDLLALLASPHLYTGVPLAIFSMSGNIWDLKALPQIEAMMDRVIPRKLKINAFVDNKE